MNLKVLVISTSYLPKINGTTLTIQNIAKGLGEMGHRIIVVTRWRAPLPRQERDGPIRVLRVGGGRGLGEQMFFLLGVLLLSRRLSGSRDVDVIHAHGLLPGLAAAFARVFYGVDFVITFHQDPHVGARKRDPRSVASDTVSLRLIKVVCRFAKFVVVQSEGMGRVFTAELKVVDFEKVAVIPNPVELETSTGAGTYNSPNNSMNVLYVGALAKMKSVDTLIRSMTQVLEQYPDAHLTIVGKGRQRDYLGSLVDSLRLGGSVTFKGEVTVRSELTNEYLRSSVLVLPSSSEAFGLVLAEALTVGTPVVATRTVGAMSIIRDGLTGLLVPVGDTNALAKAIVWTLGNQTKARMMARMGQVSVQENFGRHAVCGRYSTVLLKACESSLDPVGTSTPHQLT